MMASKTPNEFYAELADQLRKLCNERNVVLSHQSDRLLMLAVESWFEDPLPFKPTVPRDREYLTDLALNIFGEALNDPHIRNEMTRSRSVSFGPFLFILGQAGRNLVRDIVEDKGFW